jgi:hypothetical protein
VRERGGGTTTQAKRSLGRRKSLALLGSHPCGLRFCCLSSSVTSCWGDGDGIVSSMFLRLWMWYLSLATLRWLGVSLEFVFMRYCWILLMAIEHPPFRVALVEEREAGGCGERCGGWEVWRGI